MSSGQHTRITLCKGFINDPELLLLDECTVGLDPDIAEKTRRALREVQRDKQTTVLFTSRNMAEVEQLCGRIAFLSNGEILRIDTAECIKCLIPQQIVRVRFQAGADLNELLQHFGNNGLPDPQQSGTDTVQFTLGNPEQQLDSVLRYLTQASGPIADMPIGRPSLEDVFIKVARGEI